ncbi:unnamed protein product [Parnassius apollo]|uniref:(apollo) hypothetical protein n=1 Tax=Parnassius apollo TaxID=110799 RepID=A0A8S3W200_PARAO|nr:unnamed protein product [Parnassius apollo]
MVTFSKAIGYCYNTNASKLLTPLCGAIFSLDSIKNMAQGLGVEKVKCLRIVNESTTFGGQYLPDSDIACAVVCMITSTKKLSDKHVRDSMISKVVKQYIHQGKEYVHTRFTTFAKYAGDVPPGLDSLTLIEMYNAVQSVSLPFRKLKIKLGFSNEKILP